ncbi:MAG TPA: hypothetical protein VI322_04750 [Candidatus Saccharimonadia bacterium]
MKILHKHKLDPIVHTPENDESKLEYYTDLNRTTVFLFVSLIALMALLLTTGYQKPHNGQAAFMYGAIISLGTNIFVYPLSRYLQLQFSDRTGSVGRWINILRLAQLGLFAISIICLIGLALSVTQFFFKTAGV